MQTPERAMPDSGMRTPRAAAVAGIAFALLYSTTVIILRSTEGAILSGDQSWILEQSVRLRFAVGLVPFAGIAFLWFLGVMRQRWGRLEDQFFSTLFLGSGFLYLAMTFAAAAAGGSILAVLSSLPQGPTGDSPAIYLISLSTTLNNVYAVRMAGMNMMTLATIWAQSGVMPRWLVVVTYLLALLLLISVGFTLWIVLVLPAWVLLVSVYILTRGERQRHGDEAEGESEVRR